MNSEFYKLLIVLIIFSNIPSCKIFLIVILINKDDFAGKISKYYAKHLKNNLSNDFYYSLTSVKFANLYYLFLFKDNLKI